MPKLISKLFKIAFLCSYLSILSKICYLLFNKKIITQEFTAFKWIFSSIFWIFLSIFWIFWAFLSFPSIFWIFQVFSEYFWVFSDMLFTIARLTDIVIIMRWGACFSTVSQWSAGWKKYTNTVLQKKAAFLKPLS